MYLRRAASIGLGTTIKYLWRKTSAAAGNNLRTKINYFRGAREHRPGDHDQVPATQNEQRHGQRSGQHGEVPEMNSELRRRQRPDIYRPEG
jgi:hypothetical protein